MKKLLPVLIYRGVEHIEFEKLDKHNQVVERVAILERDNKTAFNRIDESRDEISHLRDQIMKKQAR